MIFGSGARARAAELLADGARWQGGEADIIREPLSEYFHRNPYSDWFRAFETLLQPLGTSFYGDRYPGPAPRWWSPQKNTALRTDICSPLATTPKWSDLPDKLKDRLRRFGLPFWRDLVRALKPDLILISVARSYTTPRGTIPRSVCGRVPRTAPRPPRGRAVRPCGYFALKHYLDYRQTGDVDAWWRSRQDPHALAAARDAFSATAAEFGYSVRERAWGETISIEAFDGANKAFSFQVSIRSVEITPPVASPWGRIPIETVDDNVASKMMALVERGAPRDFVDIKAVVDARLISAARCWELWAAKDPGIKLDDALVRVQMNLASIEARMPLERLPVERKTAAAQLRAWYREVFTDARTLGRGEGPPDGEESEQ